MNTSELSTSTYHIIWPDLSQENRPRGPLETPVPAHGTPLLKEEFKVCFQTL
jgi:hypothetical protein